MEEYNPKIIATILRHYFCNIDHLTSDADILSYYFTLLSYVQADSDIDWDEIGSDYIIWQPFEHTNPCDIVDNMQAMYEDIRQTLNLSAPNFVVNPLSTAKSVTDYLAGILDIHDDQSYTRYHDIILDLIYKNKL